MPAVLQHAQAIVKHVAGTQPKDGRRMVLTSDCTASCDC